MCFKNKIGWFVFPTLILMKLEKSIKISVPLGKTKSPETLCSWKIETIDDIPEQFIYESIVLSFEMKQQKWIPWVNKSYLDSYFNPFSTKIFLVFCSQRIGCNSAHFWPQKHKLYTNELYCQCVFAGWVRCFCYWKGVKICFWK